MRRTWIDRGPTPIRLFVAAASLLLVLLAVPASNAPGLQTHDDAVCVLTAVFLFGLTTIGSLIPLGWYGRFVLAGAFGGAWLLQALALHWIEGASITELVGGGGNVALRLWLAVYFGSIVMVLLVVGPYRAIDSGSGAAGGERAS